ncbi:MAG: hypothetical protein HY042_09635, partial [Spirochaetia bacterium]|nr:hypothetical protein [Spirochaetia bacterium]
MGTRMMFPSKVSLTRLSIHVSASLAALFAAAALSAQSPQFEEKNIVEREAMDRARKSGFGDLEIDNLHGAVTRSTLELLQRGGLAEDKGSFKELIDQSLTRRVVTGQDAEGKTYLRLRLREGLLQARRSFLFNTSTARTASSTPTRTAKAFPRSSFSFIESITRGLSMCGRSAALC